MVQQGQQVERIENREGVKATVLEVTPEGTVLISYEEGGSGWWPAVCLRPVVGGD